MKRKVSIIIPCFNEEQVLPLFWEKLCEVASGIPDKTFEAVFIDDGSQDATLSVIKSLTSEKIKTNYLSFSRNFGKEAALYAGLKAATGDLVVIMDADLQDPPELLNEMIQGIEREGYDSVATRRKDRNGESVIRSFFAKCFYRIFNYISDVKIVSGARDYRIMTRQMADAVLELGEYNRFTKGIYSWVGFKTKWIDFENVQRAAGKTKWSFWTLLLYSLEGICSFSTAPLTLVAGIGISLCSLSFLGISVVILLKLTGAPAAYGWSSLICVLFFLSGVQMFCLGILGRYLAKTYLETKHRPLYIVKEKKD
ncbi:MAG: glycosyltransferase family 2 protein [Alphaproteobacteria bacterium]|nr:glycosyltransferase family 2 protein [Alphaproteobacteria bacterium]